MVPKSPEEALAHIREAAENDEISFASDALCAQLDAEIQTIYRAIRAAEGKNVRRGLWTSDLERIEGVLEWDSNGQATAAAKETVRKAGETLGISLSVDDLWSDAALRLREKASLKS